MAEIQASPAPARPTEMLDNDLQTDASVRKPDTTPTAVNTTSTQTIVERTIFERTESVTITRTERKDLSRTTGSLEIEDSKGNRSSIQPGGCLVNDVLVREREIIKIGNIEKTTYGYWSGQVSRNATERYLNEKQINCGNEWLTIESKTKSTYSDNKSGGAVDIVAQSGVKEISRDALVANIANKVLGPAVSVPSFRDDRSDFMSIGVSVAIDYAMLLFRRIRKPKGQEALLKAIKSDEP